ncbi:MAG: spore cortex-lytic enzyme [Clostridia bacterium]|nr:spore cortex-lytic enzyme [Clostridia bacterium]
MKIKSIICVLLCLLLLASIITVLVPQEQANAATVKYGSSGTLVSKIQRKLKSWGYYTGAVDGVFGSKTLTAVKYFQRTNGLTADGIVGRATASAMGISLSSTTTSSSTSSDLYLLASCIYGEARGESYTGKVAVGAVILNRVKSSSFPNSIAGVIYQPGAFTCVSDGQINLGTNDECLKAARDAMNGWDPTYGCLFYYNPSTATSSWIRNKTVVTVIGSHVFC